MVALRVSKNILKRLMNIYIHQAAGNYTGGRYMSLATLTFPYYFKVCYILPSIFH